MSLPVLAPLYFLVFICLFYKSSSVCSSLVICSQAPLFYFFPQCQALSSISSSPFKPSKGFILYQALVCWLFFLGLWKLPRSFRSWKAKAENPPAHFHITVNQLKWVETALLLSSLTSFSCLRTWGFEDTLFWCGPFAADPFRLVCNNVLPESV